MTVSTELTYSERAWTGVETSFAAGFSALDAAHIVVRYRTIPLISNDSFTKVQLSFFGGDGSTTIADSNAGGSAHTWTANGNAQIDTADSKFGGGSLLCDGTGDFVTTPDHADFTLGSGNFTIDFWFKVSSTGGNNLAGQSDAGGTAAGSAWFVQRSGGAQSIIVSVSNGSTNTIITGSTTFTDVVNPGWHHVAVVRTGNILKLFVDGIQEGGDVAFTGPVQDSAAVLAVGNRGTTGASWNGWIDEFRLSVGLARWTSNFTPPTLIALPAGVTADVTLTAGVHYSVTLGADNAVTIVPIALPPAPLTLLISRNTPALQATDFLDLEDYAPAIHTGLHDAAAMRGAEEKFHRSSMLRVPLGEAVSELPAAALRAGKYFGFDGGGNAVAFAPPGPSPPPVTQVSTPGGTPGHRLTLTSGVPVTVADVAGATTIYWTPCVHNAIEMYDGTAWVAATIGELSNVLTSTADNAGPAAAVASKPYYLMMWDNLGIKRLTRSPAWVTDTNPGTGAGTAEIEFFEGRWVNKFDITNGPLARRGRIVGGFKTNAVAQMVDTKIQRWVSNIYNPAPRRMRQTDPATNWTYSVLGTWRQANNNPANSVSWFHALDGGEVDVTVLACGVGSNVAGVGLVGIGLDGILPSMADNINNLVIPSVVNQGIASGMAAATFAAGRGFHYATWCEYQHAAGSTSWASTTTIIGQSGILGKLWN